MNICYKNMRWKDIITYVCDGVIRFLCAAFWIVILCSFSFFDLINFIIHTSEHSISMEIIKEMKNFNMIVSTIGLIGMVYFDNILSSMLTKKSAESNAQKIILLVSVVIILYLAVISQTINLEKPNLRWESMPIVLFLAYLLSLLIYKMQSLEVVHSNGKAF